jgi:prepilin-type N-terminal cleavage/methylation domain-containing protein
MDSVALSMKKPYKGMTLIELILTMVILSVGLSGVLAVMVTIARNSVDPQIRWQAIILGNSAIQKIIHMPYHGEACPLKADVNAFASLCDYQGLTNEKIGSFFPEMKQMKDNDLYKISVDIQPFDNLIKETGTVLVSVIITHAELGETHFAAIKTKDRENDEKGMRFYTY